MPRNTESLKRGGPGRPKGAKTPRMREVLLKQQEAFVKECGREPGPEEKTRCSLIRVRISHDRLMLTG